MRPPPRFLVAAGLLTVAVVTGGSLLQRGLAGPGTRVNGARLFDAVAGQIRRNYVDSVPDDALFEKAMVGMLEELHDPHTTYLIPDRLKRLNESTSGNYTGIGVQVDRRDGWATVLGTLPGSPAERSELRSGDRLTEIDGRSTRGWTMDEARGALRGAPGTSVRLTVERPGVADPIAIEVTRDAIHRRAVGRTALMRDGVAYIDLNIFSDSTDRELSQAIDSLSGAGMRGLVLDLRGNPGGVLTQGVGVADLFLEPKALIASMRGRTADANRQFIDQTPQRWPHLPVTLLVDGGSASASEIVAGALQDHDRALVVGQTSFGKGSAQSLFPVATGGAVKLTIARWFTPLGRSIDRKKATDEDVSAADDGTREGTAKREEYRTPRGRVVYGGGGITPDVAAGDTALIPADQALQAALGARVAQFRDAMTAYALRLRTSGMVSAPDFVVTPQMREALWIALRGRGIRIDRNVYDGAAVLVSRLLAREIARYVFGPAAETQRALRDDEVVQRAIGLLAGARTPEELLKRGD